MSTRLDWNETFSVGVDALDEQHREIFAIVNAIPETVDEHLVRTCIVRLFKYTRIHFQDEEAEMRRIGYPKLDAHIRLHDALLERLSDMAVMPLNTDEANLAFKQFVLHWLVDHIMICDQDYSRHRREVTA